MLGPSHPDGLDDLEDGRSDDDKDEEGEELGGDGVAVVLLGRLGHIAPLSNVLGVLLDRLAHPWCGRHLGRFVSGSLSEGVGRKGVGVGELAVNGVTALTTVMFLLCVSLLLLLTCSFSHFVFPVCRTLKYSAVL